MKIRAIIVDDETHSLQTTELLVQRNCPEIEIVALAASAHQGIEKINDLQPDLVFLDIAMPVMNGFEMLKHLQYKSFEIIFTTAYDEYAIKAFKVNAIDYLLKPIDEDELKHAVDKVRAKLESTEQYYKIDELLHWVQPNLKKNKVAISIDGKIRMIPFDSIVYCESESNYTFIYILGEKRAMISKTLKEVEYMLHNPDFFRVQNSYLVNLNHIKEYIRGEGGELLMSNGDSVRVSRNKKEELLKRLL